MIYRLHIPLPCVSQNQTDRMHWVVRSRLKQAWKMAIIAARNNSGIPKASHKRRLVIEVHGPRVMDEANILGGLKGAVDNLTELGLIVDDSPSWLVMGTPIQIRTKQKEKAHVVLILRDVDPAEDSTRSEADRKAWAEAGIIYNAAELQVGAPAATIRKGA